DTRIGRAREALCLRRGKLGPCRRRAIRLIMPIAGRYGSSLPACKVLKPTRWCELPLVWPTDRAGGIFPRPTLRVAVIAISRRVLERILRSVDDGIPGVVLLLEVHCVEWDGYVFFAHCNETTDADEDGCVLAVMIHHQVMRFHRSCCRPDRRRLLVPICHGPIIRR